jgi:hypothetical protein
MPPLKPGTPAADDLIKHGYDKNGEPSLLTLFNLLVSGTPLDQTVRDHIAMYMVYLVCKKEPESERQFFLKAMQTDEYIRRRVELTASGMKPGKAEQAVAREAGIDVETMRKRITRSRAEQRRRRS